MIFTNIWKIMVVRNSFYNYILQIIKIPKKRIKNASQISFSPGISNKKSLDASYV